MSIDPAATFAELGSSYDRMFWLDGGGARPWSGRRSILGFLRDEDVSLTYDARAREVRRHRGGRDDVVGDDVFTVLADELARDAGDPRVSWVGYLGYACRPDLPALTSPAPGGVPDAVWMRVRTRWWSSTRASPRDGPSSSAARTRPPRRRTPAPSRSSRSSCAVATPTRST